MTSNNGDYELHIVMALCERDLGHYQAAFDYFDKAFGADSSQAGLYGYLYLGVTRLRAKDYHAAIVALEHENRIYDKFAETWYYLAQANLALGNKALAKDQLLQAQALFNDHSGKYYLHDVYCEMQDAIYLPDVEAELGMVLHANNISIATGTAPDRNGITGNVFFNPAAQKEEYIEEPSLLLVPSLFQKAQLSINDPRR